MAAYNIFDTNKLLNRPMHVSINNTSGLAGIAYWINMKFKLDLNESLFDDEEFKETKHVFNEGDFGKYALDAEFCELDYELSNSEAAASKVDTSVIPEGPTPGPNSGIADLLIAAINDEWEAIRSYNSLVASLSYESNSNPQFAQMIEVINDMGHIALSKKQFIKQYLYYQLIGKRVDNCMNKFIDECKID